MPCQYYGIIRIQKIHIKSANATSLAALQSSPIFPPGSLQNVPTPVFYHDHCTEDIFSHMGGCMCMYSYDSVWMSVYTFPRVHGEARGLQACPQLS